MELTLTRDHLSPWGQATSGPHLEGAHRGTGGGGRARAPDRIEPGPAPARIRTSSSATGATNTSCRSSGTGAGNTAGPCRWTGSRPRPPGSSAPGRSDLSYGRIVYRGPSVPFYGRWHVDRRNSFFYPGTGLPACRSWPAWVRYPCSRWPAPAPAPSSPPCSWPGPWPTIFSSPGARASPSASRPRPHSWWPIRRPGLPAAGGVRSPGGGIDFASMYPTIMAIHNISPETINCPCCSEPRVPEQTMSSAGSVWAGAPHPATHPGPPGQPEAPGQAAPDPEAAADFKARQTALKWILVTCFGYLGYKNAASAASKPMKPSPPSAGRSSSPPRKSARKGALKSSMA